MIFGDLYKTGELYLVNVGFDDFHVVAPLKIMHIQTGYTLHVVTGGRGILTINGRTHTVGVGDVFFIPPNVPMMYCPVEDDPWEYYWFYLQGSRLTRLGELLSFSLDEPVRHLREPFKIFDLLPCLFDEDFRSERQYYRAMATFMNVVSELCPEKSKAVHAQTDTVVEQAREVILLNCTNPDFTIEMLTQILHVSHSYFCKIFKKEMGMSPIRLLLDTRLSHARKLLRNSTATVKEIAAASGFRDEIHFTKEFKKKQGMTAGEYRRLNKNKG